MINNGQSAAEQDYLIKDIPGWEGQYACSNEGQIWSYKSNKFLKPSKNKRGYLHVTFVNNGKRYDYRVNRLVAMTFTDNPDNLPLVNHIDGNKLNNYVLNLEWCTPEYNIEHAKEHHLFKKTCSNPPIHTKDGPLIAYVFTNVYNGNQFVIYGFRALRKQFRISGYTYSLIQKHANTGDYIKAGLLKGLRVDKVDLKVHRLSANNGVGSSDPKYWRPFLRGQDIVKSSEKSEAAISDLKLTTSNE